MAGATLARIAAHTASWRAGLALRISGHRPDQGSKRLVGQALTQFIEARKVGVCVHAASDSVVVAVLTEAVDSIR